MLHSYVQYSTLQPAGILLYIKAQRYRAVISTVLYFTAQHFAVQYNTVHNKTVLDLTRAVLHSTGQNIRLQKDAVL